MLKSTTLPAAFLETAQILGTEEAGLTTPVNNVQISFDVEAGLANVSASIPFTASDPSANTLGLNPTDYAPVAGFDAGSLSTQLLANGANISNVSAALVKIASVINTKEAAIEAAGGTVPDGVGVGLNADFDSGLISITASLPISLVLDNTGKPVISVSDYVA